MSETQLVLMESCLNVTLLAPDLKLQIIVLLILLYCWDQDTCSWEELSIRHRRTGVQTVLRIISGRQ